MKVTTVLFLIFAAGSGSCEIAFEISAIHVRDYALNSTLDERYVTIESVGKDASQIIRMVKQNNQWSLPEVASFSGQFKDLEPFLHPNGLQLFFASNRNDEQTEATAHFDIWQVERQSSTSEWGKPTQLNSFINTPEGDEFYPSVSTNGNLYFTASKADGVGKEDIYVSRLVNGQYSQAELLPETINSATYEFNAFISPDESMLLFSSYGRSDGLGGGDLYVSHKLNDQWQTAKNLGPEINSKQLDYCPFYDVNKKTLYWTSQVSSLTNLANQHRSFTQWEKLFTEGANGMSKIYRKPIDLKLILTKQNSDK